MRLYHDRRSPYWYADLRDYSLGRRSTKIRNRKEAQRAVYEYLARLQKPIPAEGPALLSDLILRYKAYSKMVKTQAVCVRDRHILNLFAAHCGPVPAGKINQEMVESFMAKRAETVVASTINRDMAAIKNMFSKAIEWKLLGGSPCRNVKRLRSAGILPGYFTEEEIETILKTSPSEYRWIWLLFLYTGFRRGDVARLCWQDIRDGWIHVLEPKEGKESLIPVAKELEEALKEAPRASDRVVPLSPSALTHIFKRILRSAGIEGNLHRLRHSTATHLLRQGVPVHVVQRILRHASLRTTSIYTHALAEDLKAGLDRLTFSKRPTGGPLLRQEGRSPWKKARIRA